MILDADRIDIEIMTDRGSHRYFIYAVTIAADISTSGEVKALRIFNLMNTFQRLFARLFTTSGVTQ